MHLHLLKERPQPRALFVTALERVVDRRAGTQHRTARTLRPVLQHGRQAVVIRGKTRNTRSYIQQANHTPLLLQIDGEVVAGDDQRAQVRARTGHPYTHGVRVGK